MTSRTSNRDSKSRDLKKASSTRRKSGRGGRSGSSSRRDMSGKHTFDPRDLVTKRKWVLDTSAILHGGLGLVETADVRLLIPTSVPAELLSRNASHLGDIVLASSNTVVQEPTDSSMKVVLRAAKSIGAHESLTTADLEVIALAFDADAGILTDDYMIQNVAASLKLKSLGIRTKGIKRLRTYYWRCPGCRKTYDTGPRTCGVCASELVREIRGRASLRKR